MLAPAPDANGRRGRLVNTASMGGLMAAGQLTSYVMTKHAVVGLSLALRSEAAAHGVGVTAICPSAVETPMLDRRRGRPTSTAGTSSSRGRASAPPWSRTSWRPQVLEAIADDKPLLVTPRTARIAWRIGRLSPGFVSPLVGPVRRQAAEAAGEARHRRPRATLGLTSSLPSNQLVLPLAPTMLSEMCTWSRCRSVLEHLFLDGQLEKPIRLRCSNWSHAAYIWSFQMTYMIPIRRASAWVLPSLVGGEDRLRKALAILRSAGFGRAQRPVDGPAVLVLGCATAARPSGRTTPAAELGLQPAPASTTVPTRGLGWQVVCGSYDA